MEKLHYFQKKGKIEKEINFNRMELTTYEKQNCIENVGNFALVDPCDFRKGKGDEGGG